MSEQLITTEFSSTGENRRNFTIIDNPLIDNPDVFDLSFGAFKLLILLLRYEGLPKITFSVQTLAKQLTKEPKGRSAIFRFLKELEDGDLITRTQDDNGLVRQSSCVISLAPFWEKMNKIQDEWMQEKKAEREKKCSETELYEKRERNKVNSKFKWDTWEKDNFTCVYCGARKYLVVEHVIPISKGGKTTTGNCVTACRSCNSRKGNRTPEESGMGMTYGRFKKED